MSKSKKIETKTYTDGTTVTGVGPLPELSPAQQDESPIDVMIEVAFSKLEAANEASDVVGLSAGEPPASPVPPPQGVVFEAEEGTTFVTHDNGMVQLRRGAEADERILAIVPLVDLIEFAQAQLPATQAVPLTLFDVAAQEPRHLPPVTLDAARALRRLIGHEPHVFEPNLPISAFKDEDGKSRLVVQLEDGSYAAL